MGAEQQFFAKFARNKESLFYPIPPTKLDLKTTKRCVIITVMHELSPNKNPKNLVSFDKYKAYKETSLAQLQAILRNNSANLKLRLKSYEVGGSLYQGTGYSHLTFPEVTFIEKLI